MVVVGFILKNNQITVFSYFTFISKTGVKLPKRVISFYCDFGKFSSLKGSNNTTCIDMIFVKLKIFIF